MCIPLIVISDLIINRIDDWLGTSTDKLSLLLDRMIN